MAERQQQNEIGGDAAYGPPPPPGETQQAPWTAPGDDGHGSTAHGTSQVTSDGCIGAPVADSTGAASWVGLAILAAGFAMLVLYRQWRRPLSRRDALQAGRAPEPRGEPARDPLLDRIHAALGDVGRRVGDLTEATRTLDVRLQRIEGRLASAAGVDEWRIAVEKLVKTTEARLAELAEPSRHGSKPRKPGGSGTRSGAVAVSRSAAAPYVAAAPAPAVPARALANETSAEDRMVERWNGIDWEVPADVQRQQLEIDRMARDEGWTPIGRLRDLHVFRRNESLLIFPRLAQHVKNYDTALFRSPEAGDSTRLRAPARATLLDPRDPDDTVVSKLRDGQMKLADILIVRDRGEIL